MSKQIDEVMALADEFALKTDAFQNGEVSREELFAARRALKDKLRELLPIWQPIESAPFGKTVLACNSLGYVGRAVLRNGKWENIGRPTGWMPLPAPLRKEGST